jgi:hypothetical protein
LALCENCIAFLKLYLAKISTLKNSNKGDEMTTLSAELEIVK